MNIQAQTYTLPYSHNIISKQIDQKKEIKSKKEAYDNFNQSIFICKSKLKIWL